MISLMFSFSGKVNAKEVLLPNESSIIPTCIEPLENENDLQIENWMINEDFWDKSESNIDLTVTPEEDLTIQDWMSSDNFFKIDKQTVIEEKKNTLSLEKWMSDNNFWRF